MITNRSGECEHLCTEAVLLDDENVLVARSSTFVSRSTSKSLSASNSHPVESFRPVITLPFRTSSATGEAPWGDYVYINRVLSCIYIIFDVFFFRIPFFPQFSPFFHFY